MALVRRSHTLPFKHTNTHTLARVTVELFSHWLFGTRAALGRWERDVGAEALIGGLQEL